MPISSGMPSKEPLDCISIVDPCAELNIRRHDVARTHCEEVNHISVVLSALDGVSLHVPWDSTSVHDEASAEFVGAWLERDRIVLPDEDLVADGCVGRPRAVQIRGMSSRSENDPTRGQGRDWH